MKGVLLILALTCVGLQTALAIKCKKCWPPMDKDKCRASEDTINCDKFKKVGYDSCIEVRYHASHQLARTCYAGHKCEGARLWCTKYGPCEVKCCKKSYCNPAGTLSLPSVLTAMFSAAVAYYLAWR